MITVRFKKLTKTAKLPVYASAGAAGMNLFADKNYTILPGERCLVSTGVAIAVPEGFEAQVRPRSGLALKEGITVLNSPGTVDSDYRGECFAMLLNTGKWEFYVYPGDRVAQVVIAPVVRAVIEEVKELDATVRGAGGFGSSGLREVA
jgi:dUTP pyrophosphatase